MTAAALSCLVSPSPSVSIAALLRLLSAALMFVVIEQLLASRPEYVHRLLGATFAAAGLVCTWTVLQLFLAPPIDEYTGQLRLQGPFHHPNVLAKFLVVVLLALVGLALSHRGARRLAALVATIPVAVLLGLTFTRVAWIAAVLGVAYLVGKRHRLLVPVLIAGVLAISTIPAVTSRIDDLWRPEPVNGVPGNSLVWRFDYWRQLVPLWRRSPLNGIGLEVIPTVRGLNFQAHSVWVQVIVELGLVGVVGLIAVIAGFVVTSRRRRRSAVTPTERAVVGVGSAVAIALLAMSFSENLLNETTTLWYAAAAIACGLPTLGNVWGQTAPHQLNDVQTSSKSTSESPTLTSVDEPFSLGRR